MTQVQGFPFKVRTRASDGTGNTHKVKVRLENLLRSLFYGKYQVEMESGRTVCTSRHSIADKNISPATWTSFVLVHEDDFDEFIFVQSDCLNLGVIIFGLKLELQPSF